MHQWQAVVLILVSFGALIIALYCLFFMVPVKRFWERIRSLGGGMKGIEAHVDGVRNEIRGRLDAVEKAAEQCVAQAGQASEAVTSRLAREQREVKREMERFRADLQSLQAELRQTANDTMKAQQSCEALAKRVERLLGDFDALDVELRESVRQLVAESISTVESTVLSALEAMQEEIVYVANGVPEPRENGPNRSHTTSRPSGWTPAPRRTHDNIITMEPLFARLRDEGAGKGQEAAERQEGEDGEEAEEGTQKDD
jgi:hypothetical protein